MLSLGAVENSDSDQFSWSLLPDLIRDGIGSNNRETSLCLLEWFASELTQISSTRGSGPLRGSRRTPHVGQVDLDVWELVWWPKFCFITHARWTYIAVPCSLKKKSNPLLICFISFIAFISSNQLKLSLFLSHLFVPLINLNLKIWKMKVA